MKTNFFISALLGTLILCFVSFLIELPFGISWNSSYIFWMFLSNLLIVSMIGLLVRNNVQSGWKLTLNLFLIIFILGNFNILIEAFIFNVTDRYETFLLIVKGLLLAIITSPLLVFLFGKWKGEYAKLFFKPRSIIQWSWRIVAGDLLYLFFYLLAGFILVNVYPQLMDFYADKIPPFALMINTQFFRALLFIYIGLIIIRNTNLSLFKRALLVGAVFSIFGGIAPLIMPGDEFMPGYVRFGHAFEVGISNFLYGVILVYLIGQKIIEQEKSSDIQN